MLSRALGLLLLFTLCFTWPVWAAFEKVEGDPCMLSWEAVTQDVNGDPESIAFYNVEVSGSNDKTTRANTPSLGCGLAGAAAVGDYVLSVGAVDQSGNEGAFSDSIELTIIAGEPVPKQCEDAKDNDGDGLIDFPADPGCTSTIDDDETSPVAINASWEASRQLPGASWKNSTWHNKTFRVLLEGNIIEEAGEWVKVTVRKREDGKPYTFSQMSLVTREVQSLNGVDATLGKVTFGGAWEAPVTVSGDAPIVSDAIKFTLVPGQDVFLTFWVPEDSPTVYRNAEMDGVGTWVVNGSNETSVIDWEELTINDTRGYVYVADFVGITEAPAIPDPDPDPVGDFACEGKVDLETGTFTMMCSEVSS